MGSPRVILSAIAVCTAIGAFLGFFQVAAVRGDSMMPSLRDGQLVLALRHFGRLRRGDVVLLRRGQETLIKRVAYLPGDRIAKLDAPLFRGSRDFFEEGSSTNELIVPRGRIVVVGDNRPRSDDSRHFGPVALRSVTGRVVAVSSLP